MHIHSMMTRTESLIMISLLLFLHTTFSWAFSATNTAAPAAARQKNQYQYNNQPTKNQPQKPWRFSKPKKSKWDVRHTKNFRFTLKAPAATPSSTNTNINNNINATTIGWDTLPMHKKPRESLSHVLGKGLLWALFKDQYGNHSNHQMILVETPIPQEPRFVPDAVAFQLLHVPSKSTACTTTSSADLSENHTNPVHFQPDTVETLQPTFWGESGRMSVEKAEALATKYPHTHIVHFRWGATVSMNIFEEIEAAVLPTLEKRTAPFEFALFQDHPKNCIDEDGVVALRKEDLQWRKVGFDIDLQY